MQYFKDKHGDQHLIEMTFATILNVLENTNVDLLNPGIVTDGVTTSQALIYNQAILARVIWFSCVHEPQTATESSFMSALDGAAFHSAEVAFWTEYKNFFVQSGREWLAIAIAKELEQRQTQAEQAENILNELPGVTSGK